MLTHREKILIVKISRAEGVQQRQITARSVVKAPGLLAAGTGLRADEFLPAVIAAVEDSQRPERHGEPALVEPHQQFLKVPVHCHGLGFIDELEPRAAFKNPNRPPAPVTVAGVPRDVDDRAGVLPRTESLADRRPVRLAASQDLQAARDPVLKHLHDQSRQHGVFAEESGTNLPPPEAIDETGKALLAGLAAQ